MDRVFEQVERVMATGCVDAIDINSGTMARVGMDAMMLAGALEARGVETIPHLTTRDLNLIGLQAMLLGAWSVGGIRNVLAITGDPPSLGDHPETSGVYEIDSIGLVKVIARLNQGTDWAGKTSAAPRTIRSAWPSIPWPRIRCRDQALLRQGGSRRAFCDDPASFRSRALAAVPPAHGRPLARARPRRHLAPEQL